MKDALLYYCTAVYGHQSADAFDKSHIMMFLHIFHSIYQLEDILLFTERNALTNKSSHIRYFAWHFAVNNLIPDNFIPAF